MLNFIKGMRRRTQYKKARMRPYPSLFVCHKIDSGEKIELNVIRILNKCNQKFEQMKISYGIMTTSKRVLNFMQVFFTFKSRM
jgi:hypothetical protein